MLKNTYKARDILTSERSLKQGMLAEELLWTTYRNRKAKAGCARGPIVALQLRFAKQVDDSLRTSGALTKVGKVPLTKAKEK